MRVFTACAAAIHGAWNSDMQINNDCKFLHACMLHRNLCMLSELCTRSLRCIVDWGEFACRDELSINSVLRVGNCAMHASFAASMWLTLVFLHNSLSWACTCMHVCSAMHYCAGTLGSCFRKFCWLCTLCACISQWYANVNSAWLACLVNMSL